MSAMRTTLTIDPDVEQLLRREMRRSGRGMKAVVNDALRAGLGAAGKPRAATPYRVEPHPLGLRPGIDAGRLNQRAVAVAPERRVRKLGE